MIIYIYLFNKYNYNIIGAWGKVTPHATGIPLRPQGSSVFHSTDITPRWWYEWDGSVGIFPALPLITDAELAIGSTTTAISTVAFSYLVNKKIYTKTAVAAGTAPGDDVIPTAEYGAVALDIGTDGTIDVKEAYKNALGYTTAALATTDLPPVAGSHVRLGTVSVTKSDGAFTFGTTALNAANVTTVYTDTTSTATVYIVERPSSVSISTNILMV